MHLERGLDDYFSTIGFFDLLPLALRLADQAGYGKDEIVEAICKVVDKHRVFPPSSNRTAWFAKVFQEKLGEARADILRRNYLRNL
ncbi:hypothetical protein [Desulfoscipio geothermicus]|uniref:Uncharacterized protein n=1 Tax=Desulfoscipio geothermicus DSM 3669 TaxID=1121426 RepID=A0A1I6EL24_9FIRM|nr:hypothetical protein [Desulfoscipio geothermicus]SFR18395.1 hypothetical protein SAMN05660706_1583 [Desulfoscipio geothermicus DSM 3669]